MRLQSQSFPTLKLSVYLHVHILYPKIGHKELAGPIKRPTLTYTYNQMTSSQSYALLLCLKVCQMAGQPIHFYSLQLARAEDTGTLARRLFKRAMFLEQMKNKNVQTKNVSQCPIMAASVTFLRTLCCAGARPQTKDLHSAIESGGESFFGKL